MLRFSTIGAMLVMLLLGPPVRAQYAQVALTATNVTTGSRFGADVAIADDTIIVGAPHDYVAGQGDGAVCIFRRSGVNWVNEAKLKASDGGPGDYLGFSVAISGDTAVAGAYGDDVGAAKNLGSAYVFTRSGSTWSEQQKLTASDAGAGDHFGLSVGVSGDTIVVGSPYDYDGTVQSGSAFVFSRSAGVWTEQAKLVPSDPSDYMEFGGHVAIQGDTVVVGAYRDRELGQAAGAAYMFTRSGGVWTQKDKILAPDGQAYDWFGYTGVSMAGDLLAVGRAAGGGVRNYGSVYVLRLGSSGLYREETQVKGEPVEDHFAWSPAITEKYLVLGAPYDSKAGNLAGAVHVYANKGGIWQHDAKLTASDTGPDDLLGVSLATGENCFVCGAPGKNDQTGAAYVFYYPAYIQPGSFRLPGDGSVCFRFSCTGGSVQVQSSEDLEEWETVETFENVQGTIEFMDTRTLLRTRCYRLLVP